MIGASEARMMNLSSKATFNTRRPIQKPCFTASPRVAHLPRPIWEPLPSERPTTCSAETYSRDLSTAPRLIQHKNEAKAFYAFLSQVYDYIVNPGKCISIINSY